MSDTAIDQAVPTAVQDDREVTSNKSSNSSIGREDEEIAASDKEQQPSQSSLEIANKFSDIEPSQLLQYIAETNQVREPWETIREAVKEAIVKQCEIMESKADRDTKTTIEASKTNVIHSIDHHKETPFTVQRLCELVTDPRKHYRMFHKYINAIEKALLVTSSWKEFPECTETNGAASTSPEVDSDVLFGIPGIANCAELEPIPFSVVDENGTQNKEDKEEEKEEQKESATTSEQQQESNE